VLALFLADDDIPHSDGVDRVDLAFCQENTTMSTKIPTGFIPKALFLPALTAASYNIPAERLPSAPQFSRAIVGGRIPAINISGRWFLSREDIPAILGKLGLSIEETSVQTASGAA
jgi:hypothetical protein